MCVCRRWRGGGSVVLPIQMCEYCLVIPGSLLHVYIPAGSGVGSELAWVHSLRLPLYNHPITCRPLCPELKTESRAWQELGTVFTGNWGLKSLPGLNSVSSFSLRLVYMVFIVSEAICPAESMTATSGIMAFLFYHAASLSPPYLGSRAL